MIYVAIDGDDVGRKLASGYLANRVENLKATKDLIDLKTRQISELLLSLSYDVLFCAADGVTGALKEDQIDTLSLYQKVALIGGDDISFSIGVGNSLRESTWHFSV